MNALSPFVVSRISVDNSTGCWLWTGAKKETGYGRVRIAGKQIPSHRHVYQVLVGPVPEGLELDHLCRVRACCNPEHLEPVTRAENIRRARAAVTHCPQGHAYDDANTYIYNGRRVCRACNNAATRRRTAKLRETVPPIVPGRCARCGRMTSANDPTSHTRPGIDEATQAVA